MKLKEIKERYKPKSLINKFIEVIFLSLLLAISVSVSMLIPYIIYFK